MADAAVAIFLGDFAGLRAAVEAAEASGPEPLARFEEVADFVVSSHEHHSADDARWLMARASGECAFWVFIELLSPLKGEPDELRAWAAAVRHIPEDEMARMVRDTADIPARLVLMGGVGPARRALSRSIVAAMRGRGRPRMIDLLAARMGAPADLAPSGGLTADPAAGPYPAGEEDTRNLFTAIAAVAAGGRAEARRAFDSCDSAASSVIGESLPFFLANGLLGGAEPRYFDDQTDIGAISADPATRECYRRRRRAARARLVEYGAWRAAAAAACVALGRRSAGALAAADGRYRRSLWE